MARIIVFDVNETLLDLKALDPHFQRLFGDAGVKQKWFAQVLQTSLLVTITNSYVDFGVIGGHALEMVAARHGIALTDDDRAQITQGMRSLPPHADVIDNLERLQAAGLRLATLTNSSPAMVQAQLTNAGLMDYFEQTLSVEAVRRFKPAAEVYRMAAEKLKVDISQMRLVAAHEWDVTGAMRAGAASAFIARPGMVLGPLSAQPDIVGNNLYEVTDQILKIDL